jgi:anaerobic selenocysteine-containing dehydrogenase
MSEMTGRGVDPSTPPPTDRADASVHRNFCRLCGIGCGCTVTVADQRVIEVRGDATNRISDGYICGKARTLATVQHDPRRFVQAFHGRGDERAPVPIDPMLDELAAALRDIIDRRGADAVGVYLGTNGIIESGAINATIRFVSALRSRSYYTSLTVDAIARIVASLKMTGGKHAVRTSVDFPRAKLVLMIGHNPVVSHNGWTNPVTKLRNLRAQGEVWVVDPRRTETANLATSHLQIRATTDALLLACLVREVLVDGADLDYISEHVDGVDRLREMVEHYTVEMTAPRVGLTESAIRELIASIRRVGRINVTTGTGPRMGPHPTVTEWLALALSIITGSVDRPGGTRVVARGFPYAPTWAEHVAPGPRSRPELSAWIGQYPCAALADEIEAGNLRALISIGGNPANALPDEARMMSALNSLEVFAVNDIVPTQSTAAATHILPGTSQFETDSFMRGVADDDDVLGIFAPAIFDPPGDCRSVPWYLAELGRRLDIEGFSEPASLAEIHCPRRPDIVADAQASANGEVVIGKMKPRPVVDSLPGRRWQIAPDDLVAEFGRISEPPPLVLTPRRQKRHINSFLVDIAGPSGVLDTPLVLMHPTDARRNHVGDGAEVVVATTTQSVVMRASVTGDIAPGSISVPHGYASHNVNVLTNANDVDLTSGMPLYCGVPVTVRPL